MRFAGQIFDMQVAPSESGGRRSCCFCFTLCCSSRSGGSSSSSSSQLQHSPLGEDANKLIEQGPQNLPLGVTIRGLRKVFPSANGSAEVVAVDKVALDLHRDQIFWFAA